MAYRADREVRSTSRPLKSSQRLKTEGSERLEFPTALPVSMEPVDRVTCRAGDNSCANAHATTLNRATGSFILVDETTHQTVAAGMIE